MEIKAGNIVEWESQAMGIWKRKIGRVIVVEENNLVVKVDTIVDFDPDLNDEIGERKHLKTPKCYRPRKSACRIVVHPVKKEEISFKIGDRVRWESQAMGIWKRKIGTVVEVNETTLVVMVDTIVDFDSEQGCETGERKQLQNPKRYTPRKSSCQIVNSK